MAVGRRWLSRDHNLSVPVLAKAQDNNSPGSPDLAGHEPSLVISSGAGDHVGRSPSIWRRIQRDAILLGSGSIGIVIAQLGFRSILIAALVPAAYGRLSLILSLYNAVMIVGASGLPNSAARYIALGSPADDSMIVRSAVRAAVWPTAVAATIIAIVSGILLNSPLACLFAAVGLSSMVYSVLATGILRGRGRVGPSISIMPIAAISEVGLLAVLWMSGLGVTPLSAFGLFCLGNLIGLVVGVFQIVRTAPQRAFKAGLALAHTHGTVPTSRQLLGFSMWLGAATVGITCIPLIMRFAAATNSYSVVAMIDVSLVLLGIPQRVGTVIVQAVIPHATRALGKGEMSLTISRREHLVMIIPFAVAAAVVAFTPILGWLFDALGRPTYAKSADYLALALLAGPARILYGLVEGILVARGEARFMGLNALSISAIASGVIVAIIALGYVTAAFAVFVIAWWAIYLSGLARIHRSTLAYQPSSAQTLSI